MFGAKLVKVYLRDSENLSRTLSFQGYVWRLCRLILYNDAPLRVHVKLFLRPQGWRATWFLCRPKWTAL